MKRLIVAAITTLSMLIVPAAAVHAAGPPPPMCEPEGNMCIVNHQAVNTDRNGVTLTVTWSTDVNSGYIESQSNTITLPGGARDCNYSVDPYLPNSDAVVSYDYTLADHTTSAIEIHIYASGTSSNINYYDIAGSC